MSRCMKPSLFLSGVIKRPPVRVKRSCGREERDSPLCPSDRTDGSLILALPPPHPGSPGGVLCTFPIPFPSFSFSSPLKGILSKRRTDPEREFKRALCPRPTHVTNRKLDQPFLDCLLPFDDTETLTLIHIR